mmetsp:Transcript_128532/g.250422  ORF Transcript_128532/g.250422 Transcript_128532/m.250422 type:complete len:589 (+) Transcript_128532:127-1893(+)
MVARLPRYSGTGLVITRSAPLTLALAIFLWLTPLRDPAWVRHALLALHGFRCRQPNHSRSKAARAQSAQEVSWTANDGPPSLEKRLAAAKDRFRLAPSEATLAELLRAAGPKDFITNCADVQGHWQINLFRGGDKVPVFDPARLLLGLYAGKLGRAMDMEIASAPVAIIAANGTVETRVGLRWGTHSDKVTLHSHIIARQNQLEQTQQTAHSAALNFTFPLTPPRKLTVIFRDSDLLILRDAWGVSALWRLPSSNAPVKRKPRLQGRTRTAGRVGKLVAPSASTVRYPGLELKIDELERHVKLGGLRTKAGLNAADADIRHLEDRVQEDRKGIAQNLTTLKSRIGFNHEKLQQLGRDLQEVSKQVGTLFDRLDELEGRVAINTRGDLAAAVMSLGMRIKELEEQAGTNSGPNLTKRVQDLEALFLEMQINTERTKVSQEDIFNSNMHQLRSWLNRVEMRADSTQEGMQLLSSRVEDFDRRNLAPKGWVEQRLGEFWRQLRTRLRNTAGDGAGSSAAFFPFKRVLNWAGKVPSENPQSHFNVMMRLEMQSVADRLDRMEELKKRTEQQGKAVADLKKRLQNMEKLLFSI